MRSKIIEEAIQSGIYDYNDAIRRFMIENPDIEIRTDLLSINESIDKLVKFILPLVEFKN